MRQAVIVSFLVCLTATLFVLHKLNRPIIGIDDANIYFVYARNLADGAGFVYNAGGERVEGFTSLLWTLLSALAFRISSSPEVILLIVNIILVSLGIAYALHYLQKPHRDEKKNSRTGLLWSALFLLIIFTSPRYVVWNTATLMENALWSTLLLCTAIFVIQDHGSVREINTGFIPLSIMLLITRPESFLWVAVFLGILFFRLAFTGGVLYALKALAPSMIGILLAFLLLTGFRLLYFGYPLPNTYYAKVSPSLAYNLEQGAVYLIRYLLSDPIAVAGFVSIVLACVYSIRQISPAKGEFYLPFIAATGLLAPLLTGGDHFGSFRFYQNVYPITILCLIYFLRTVFPHLIARLRVMAIPSGVRMFAFPALALIFLFGFGKGQAAAWSHFLPEIQGEFDIAEYERANGAFIQDLFSSLPRLPSLGVIAAGGIKVSYSGEVIDLAGLNNTLMAHNHGDRIGYKGHAAFEKKTFYELQPQILLPSFVDENWHYSETGLKNGWENTLAFKGLFNEPQFLDRYQYAKVCKAGPSGCDLALVAWFKKDFLDSLVAEGNFRIERYEYNP
jgi:hypothetical protein